MEYLGVLKWYNYDLFIFSIMFLFLGVIIMRFYPLYGSKWINKKIELLNIHAKKEKAFYEYLKKNGVWN